MRPASLNGVLDACPLGRLQDGKQRRILLNQQLDVRTPGTCSAGVSGAAAVMSTYKDLTDAVPSRIGRLPRPLGELLLRLDLPLPLGQDRRERAQGSVICGKRRLPALAPTRPAVPQMSSRNNADTNRNPAKQKDGQQ